MSKKNRTKVYKPKGEVIPAFTTNTITDNVTNPRNERVYNRSIENVELSKREVDANHK